MSPTIQNAYDPETFRSQGHRLVDQLADWLGQSQRGIPDQVLPYQAPEVLYAQYEQGDQPDLFASMLQHTIRLLHPYYVGHQIAPPAPISSLSSLLVDTVNNGMGVYEMGQAGTVMERKVIAVLAQALGFDEGADGFLTSGGSLANLTALLAARQAKTGGDPWQVGTLGKPLAMLVSAEAHYCVDRAVRIMGWGEKGLVKVPVDDHFRMRIDQLSACFDQATADGYQVIAVLGTACSTATGSFDDLDGIADFCEARGLWFHVDAAHGGSAAFSTQHRHLLNGIARADSVIVDFHKMLLTPALATGLIFREGNRSYETFTQKAAYLWEHASEQEWFNLARRTFECTKQMMSAKVYAIWQAQGTQLWEDYVDTTFAQGPLMAQLIEAFPELELAVAPSCNIVCYRYVAPGLSPEALDRLNAGIRKQIVQEGRFYLVQTQVGERLYLRSALMNPFCEEQHLRDFLAEVVRVGKVQLKVS